MTALVTLAVIALLWWGLDRWHATAEHRAEEAERLERERWEAFYNGKWTVR
jgi:hypothetical protein